MRRKNVTVNAASDDATVTIADNDATSVSIVATDASASEAPGNDGQFTVSLDGGVLAAAGVLTIIPGAIVIYFVRGYIAKGFALGRV